ncbi:TraB/GumN family protein [Aliiglaciecola sp. LCG003]|uniref:TraB/GumN family protein n=1 Tax=Aliiglaciecola sp. LCG003 TaxID=3053655 RepID=UPI0025741409|nr:TraB/GumN family protein [Aliiglaciecola sp. LCG003]WJG11098.1 TraB/GumN family protein [Aliiglaciecola sp. LCG003]
MFNKILLASLGITLTLTCHAASVWKVSKNGDKVFIGGTIHLLSKSDYPLPKEYETAYDAADTLVFETDISTMNSVEFKQKNMGYMLLADGKTIKDMISADTFKQLEAHFESRNLPINNFLPFKPSFLAITLTLLELQQMGISNTGVDMYYATKGTIDGKSNSWLEEPEEQLTLLANMGAGREDQMIAYALSDIKEIQQVMPKMIAAWRSGNTQALNNIGITDFKADYPNLYHDLLVDRNQKWLPKIEALFNNQHTELVLVGALHLVGEDSVLAMLKNKGYQIEKL